MITTFMNWLSEGFAPKVTKASKNIWIVSLQDTLLKIMPLILVGSVATLGGIIREYWSAFPDLGLVSRFSFGIIGIVVAFLLPYTYLEKKGYEKVKFVALFAGLGLFLMVCKPEFTDNGTIFDISLFGSDGMFMAMLTGIITALVMELGSKISFFKKDSTIPDFMRVWFDTILPVMFLLIMGWVVVYLIEFDVVEAVRSVIRPISGIAESYPGFVFIATFDAILYSMGISPYITGAIINPIMLSSIAINAEVFAAGGVPELIVLKEVESSGWYALGGIGSTLPLVIYMCFLAKSSRYKLVGRASIVPGIMNINEPIVFGAIAWNPLLMLPMILSTFINSSITYVVLRVGLVPIPHEVMRLWYIPYPFQTWLISRNGQAIVLLAVTAAISFLIYYPFFKIADKQQLENEKKAVDEKTEW